MSSFDRPPSSGPSVEGLYLLGRLMVVWGVMAPVFAFPMMSGYQPQLGLLGSLHEMHLFLEVVDVPFVGVLYVGLVLLWGGLSMIALSPRG